MKFWENYLNNPPFDVTSNTTGKLIDSHIVLRRGYQEFSFEELWNFGAGMSWRTYPIPLPNFVEHGGYTLCGLQIQSGQNMYAPRWNAFVDARDTSTTDPALIDLHGVSCMICRRKLMHDICRIIGRLSSLRDSVGEEYVTKAPLIHGKDVIDYKDEGGTVSETYRLHCSLASEEISPRLADGEKEFERISCPECIASFKAEPRESL